MSADWNKLPPHNKPYIGCLNCGGGEMRGDAKKITATMRTRIHESWFITRDAKVVFRGSPDAEWDDLPTLMKFENMARKDPDHDWRAECIMGLRDATYQRQGRNQWVLVASGPGDA